MSIRTRIAISGGVVIFGTLLVFNVILLGLFTRGQISDRDRLLTARAEQALASLQAAPADAFVPRSLLAPIDIGSSAGAGEIFVQILNAAGDPIVSSGELGGAPPSIAPSILALAADGRLHVTTTASNGVDLRISIESWRRPDLGLSGYLVTGQPSARVAQQVRGLRNLLWFSSALILLAAFLASWSAAGRALKPLKTMAQATDEIGATGDLRRRLPETRRNDEIGRLTASFNSMLNRLQSAQGGLAEALATQRRFVADASHELRTPLTTIRSNAGFLLARADAHPGDRAAALHDIAAESERMSRLVEDLLTLARADVGQRIERTPLDLTTLIGDLIRQAQRLQALRTIRLEEPAATEPIVVDANHDALTQLFWILIDNAVKHTQRDGVIELRLAAVNDMASFMVCDDGPGIPTTDLERIFERFHQADRARTMSGAGLGLAIARWIVDQHGGRISARNNLTQGATFEVELPLADPRLGNA